MGDSILESVCRRRPSYTFASSDLSTVELEIARVGIGPMLHGSVRRALSTRDRQAQAFRYETTPDQERCAGSSTAEGGR